MVTTQAAAPPVRAVRLEHGASAGPVRFAPRGGRRRFGGVRVTQFVLVELAGAAVLLSLGRPVWWSAVGALVALALVVLAFGWSGGRWWTEWLLLRREFRRRSSAVPAPTDDARLAALGRLAAGLSVRTIADRGNRIGIGQDDAGWFAAVAITPPAGLRGDPVEDLPLDALARVLDEASPRVSALQVVLHSLPAPAALLDETAPAARSYRELASGNLGVQPIEQRCWVAVRFDPAAAGRASASRGGGLEGVHRALSTTIGRLGKAVSGAGLEYEILDGEGLLDALAQSCGVTGYVDPEAVRQIREDWTGWRAGGLAHTCFWVRDWPRLADVGGLLGRLARTPSVLSTVALTMEPQDDGTDFRCVVRVAAQPDRMPDTCRALQQLANVSRARLFRLDGAQAPAVYASAPTGGGAR